MGAYRRPQRVRIHEFRSQRSKTEAAAQIGPASRILTGDSSRRALQMGEWGVRGRRFGACAVHVLLESEQLEPGRNLVNPAHACVVDFRVDQAADALALA